METRLGAEAKQYGVTFINCVVDEICPKEPTVEESKLCLKAESYREWIVGGAHCPTLSDILGDGRITIVPPEHIDVYEQRKLWFVNGFQLAMAIHGVYRGLPLNAALAECLTIDGEFVRGIEQELIQAFVVMDSKKVLTAVQHSAFFEKLRERIKRLPDTIGRILENAIRSPDRMEKVETDFLGDLKGGSTLKKALERHLSNAVIDFIDKWRNACGNQRGF